MEKFFTFDVWWWEYCIHRKWFEKHFHIALFAVQYENEILPFDTCKFLLPDRSYFHRLSQRISCTLMRAFGVGNSWPLKVSSHLRVLLRHFLQHNVDLVHRDRNLCNKLKFL